MNEPYFQVGEEVLIQCETSPQDNGDATVLSVLPPSSVEIKNPMSSGDFIDPHNQNIYWMDKSYVEPEGWSGWYFQSTLRKKHKPSTKSFSQLITNIEPIEA